MLDAGEEPKIVPETLMMTIRNVENRIVGPSSRRHLWQTEPMEKQILITDLSTLPAWVRQKIEEIGIDNPGQWIRESIPALGYLSVIQTLTNPNGEKVLREYFAKVAGRF